MTGVLNGKNLFNVQIPTFKNHGFAGLGTTSWGIADFDNFVIASPYDGRKILQQLNPLK